MPEHFFASCPRGLEAPLADELQALAASEVQATDGGCSFQGPLTLAYHVNLESRVASRVLWRVARGRYRGEGDLYELAQRQHWHDWFAVDKMIRVNVTDTDKTLRSPEFAALKIKDGICDRFRSAQGKRPSIDKAMPDVQIHAFLAGQEVQLYLDTSGDALFKRGWRRATEEAPLRENLAAGILRLSGWTPDQPLFDPMCGSGTFLVEAAQIALDMAPGLERLYGFRHLSWFDAREWQRIKLAARARVKPVGPLPIFGADRARSAIATATANLQAAGLADAIDLDCADVLAAEPPVEQPGVLVTNPPYGERIGELNELAAFYPKLGDVLKQRFTGWRAFLFTGDLRLPKLIGLRPSRKTPLFNGALECRLYGFDLVSGRPTRTGAEAAPDQA